MEKKFIEDKQGNKVLPITHVSAVLDDSGNDIGSVMGAFEDEVRGMITTPNQGYVTVEANSSTTTANIATVINTQAGDDKQKSDTIYRVSNWDGSQYIVTSYSEYAYNGSNYVFLCQKSQIGEVFDISAYNSNTKYADLSAALGTNGANVPQELRKGGMSVKYVSSSDHKYVQFRLMADSWSVTPSDWQGVDDEPTDGSDNLTKSGTTFLVEQKTKELKALITGETIQIYTTERGKYIPTNVGVGNHIGQVTDGATFDYVRHPAFEGDKFTLTGRGGVTPRLYAFIDEDEKVLSVANADEERTNYEITAPANSAEVIINFYNTFTYGPFTYKKNNPVNERLSKLEVDTEQLPTEINNVLFGGDVYKYFQSLAVSGYIPNSASSGVLPSPVSSDTVKYILFPVYVNDVFKLNLYSGSSARAWTLVDKEMNIIRTCSTSLSVCTDEVQVDRDGFILFNLIPDATIIPSIIYNGLYILRTNVLGAIECFYEIEPTEIKEALYKTNGTEEAAPYKTSFFSVSGGDYLEVQVNSFPSSGYSLISAWNNGVFVSSLLNTPTAAGIYNITIPANCTDVGITFCISAKKKIYVNEAVELLENKLQSINSKIQKSIKCLFIGNSVSQDHVSYLPWLMKNTYPDVNFEIYQAYCAGKTVKEYVTDIIPNELSIQIFSEAKNTQVWTNKNSSVTFDNMFNGKTYDLICFEGYFHSTDHGSSDEDTAYFEQLINHIRTLQTTPFKLAYLIHQQYDDDVYEGVNVLQQLINAARFTIANNEVTMIFPCGLVTEMVKDSFGTSFLTEDNIHNNQGLPCIMGAYTLLGNIARYLGLKDMIINNPNRITAEVETSLHIPGPNGTLKIGTDAQYEEAQSAAVKAMKYGDYLMIDAAKSIIQLTT